MCGFLVVENSQLEAHSKKNIKEISKILNHRGPDAYKRTDANLEVSMFFSRLAIVDLNPSGNQPFKDQTKLLHLVCNGEIYNEPTLRPITQYPFTSKSDCEIILPLYKEHGLKKMISMIDGEFAFVLYDKEKKKLMAARDPIGIRPLFYGFLKDGSMAFASEAKALLDICSNVLPFPPGHYFDGLDFKRYWEGTSPKTFHGPCLDKTLSSIKSLLTKAVEKRLRSDAPLGFLLSGGLDSSLVCAIASRLQKNSIRTFAIGMEGDAIDLKYAKEVADFLGADHTEVVISKEDALKALKNVIYHLETWDITTIRASIGMFLVCKYIREKTDIKVLLTGEVSDELFGYKYTDFAPSEEEFQKEAKKRIDEIYMYDVLRADRCLSAHSIEARVPFGDKEFVEYVMAISPQLKMNTTGVGKYLLRKAFEKGGYLPKNILFREKAAFSDAVGHSLVDFLKSHAEILYTEREVKKAKEYFRYCPPFTKESLLYRNLFEEFYEGKASLIKDFWMPNNSWSNCNVTDPSARALPNYGASGQ